MYSKEIKKLIALEIVESIEECSNVYGGDLAYKLYNEDYYIIGYFEAKEFLKNFFDDMIETLEQYKEETGENYPDVTDTEKLASLLVLNVAREILNDSNTLNKKYDTFLCKDDILIIKNEIIEKYL